MKRVSTLALALVFAGCGTSAPAVDDSDIAESDVTTDQGEADGSEVDANEDTPESDTPEPDVSDDAPDPDTPEPDVLEDAPEPDAPEPDAPEPDAPEPDAPEPDAPEPDAPEPDAPEPDAVDDAGEADTSDDAPDAATYCGADDSAFPDFRTGCEVAADCAPAFHQVDCCGTEAAIAVLASSLSEFTEAEAQCRDEFPACRCLARATETDDGVVVDSLDDFEVACERGVCRSVGRESADVICEDQIPTTFPGFDNSCEEYDDCVAVAHQTDCCGNVHMVGINRAAAEDFELAEGACRDAYPACGCPAGPASTDSGTFAFTPEVVEAMCREGVCWTYVPL